MCSCLQNDFLFEYFSSSISGCKFAVILNVRKYSTDVAVAPIILNDYVFLHDKWDSGILIWFSNIISILYIMFERSNWNMNTRFCQNPKFRTVCWQGNSSWAHWFVVLQMVWWPSFWNQTREILPVFKVFQHQYASLKVKVYSCPSCELPAVCRRILSYRVHFNFLHPLEVCSVFSDLSF